HLWNRILRKQKKEEDNNILETVAERRRLLKFTLLNTAEGSVFLVGVTLALIYTAWLGSNLVFAPENAQDLIGMTATEILFGRAAGMAFGYNVGLDNVTVIPICIILETILVLIAYPLFVFSWRHLVVIKSLRTVFEGIRHAAETHKDKVHKYGIVGLFAFVWFPFWMTGPVVGCAIGFLMGLPVWLDLTVVLAGTYIAILGWAFILHTLHQQVAEYSPYAAMVLMLIIVVIIIIGHLLSQAIQENKKKNSK
ncbi:MAG: small multi-drug export protein, partial [Sedimentisphaerales bacterium]